MEQLLILNLELLFCIILFFKHISEINQNYKNISRYHRGYIEIRVQYYTKNIYYYTISEWHK